MSALRCSEASRAAGEPLAATATTVERWLLLEVPGTWARDVGDEQALPESAASAARAWLERSARSRLLFLRRPARRSERRLAYVLEATETQRAGRRLELGGLEDLADVDLDRDGERLDGPLVLVCGHGSRDACCALLGTPVFGSLAELEAETWISSHQGGHRFAANVLVLPAGLQLGRLEPHESLDVVAAALGGRIALDRYRGRTFYEPAAQAAEIAVRRAFGLLGIDELQLVAVEGPLVRFRTADGREVAAEVDEVDGPAVPASCGAEPEQQRSFTARVV